MHDSHPYSGQLDDDLIARLDSRAVAARRSRSDLVREAVARYLTDDPATAIDAAIVESYTRMPPDEDFGAAWAARMSIEAEPWEALGDAGGRPEPTERTDLDEADP